MRGRRILLAAVIVAAGAAISAYYWQAKKDATASLDRGKRFLRQRRDKLAEQELSKYLSWFPNDAAGILAWAEAVVNGRERLPEAAAQLAIDKLATIPDQSPLAAEARMREGSLLFLILQKPAAAEQRLQRSAELDPNLADTWYLIWKLRDMTERFHYSEDAFFRSIERTPENKRPERLREWYLSQFSPKTANADLDRRMGFLAEGVLPNDNTEGIRLMRFLEKEPDSALIVAANARWLLHVNQRDEALRVLVELTARDVTEKEPFYVAAMISVLIELGRIEEAKQWFSKWPGEKAGYLYWTTAGRFFEVAERDAKTAVEHYSKALNVWPGPADWSLMHRRAQCLSRLGDRQAAETARAESRRVELLMESDVHQKLLRVLLDLSDRAALQEMVTFYQSLHREQEAKLWTEVIERLPKNGTPVY
jgi:tetratricopeptide (TPR) repeat protein